MLLSKDVNAIFALKRPNVLLCNLEEGDYMLYDIEKEECIIEINNVDCFAQSIFELDDNRE